MNQKASVLDFPTVNFHLTPGIKQFSMNVYQREQIIHLQGSPWCRCYDEGIPDLPTEQLDAVQQGKGDIIKNYLDNNGNVNSLCDDECLLSKACEEGQVEIVKLLLQCPDTHLNFDYKGMYPLDRASRRGNMECVWLLLDAPLDCEIRLEGNWASVAKCLEMKPQLRRRSISYIFRCALKEGRFNVLQPILKINNHLSKEEFHILTLVAVNNNRWDIVYDVLRKDFCGKTELGNIVLTITVSMRSWDKTKEILQLVDSDLKFDIDFVEAALTGKSSEARELLKERQYDAQTLNGNLVVVAAGGTSESGAEILMNIRNVYTQETFSKALFLAAHGYYPELLPRLLLNPEASYSVYDLHQANEVINHLPIFEKRDGLLMKFFKSSLNTVSLRSDERF